MDDKGYEKQTHQLLLKKREDLQVDGVLNVESFDEAEIMVETVAGGLIVRGEDLHIAQLNLDAGEMQVHGFVESIEYTGDALGKKARGVLSRLFK